MMFSFLFMTIERSQSVHSIVVWETQKGEAAWRKKTLSENGIRKTVCKTVQLRCHIRQTALFLRIQLERNESSVFGRF